MSQIGYSMAPSRPQYLIQAVNQGMYFSAASVQQEENISFKPVISSFNTYGSDKETKDNYLVKPKAQEEFHFAPDSFLKPSKNSTFVGVFDDVKDYVEQAFNLVFEQEIPNDIKISILNKNKFRQIAPHPSTVGLAINRSEQGLLSEIFVLNDTLARTLLTIGHELGHVLSPTLSCPVDEEAKAYAFSLMWMQIIKSNNIAGLKDAIIFESPAENGLHDVAYEFVYNKLQLGVSVAHLYKGLMNGLVSVCE